MADAKKKDPQYDQAELKRELTMVQGFDFEIHDEFTLMRVKSRNNGPLALVRMKHMPRTTKELIHVVQSTFFLHLHPICTSFAIQSVEGATSKGRTYTRSGTEESYARDQALKEFKLGFNSVADEQKFLLAVKEESEYIPEPARSTAKLDSLEWGTSDGKSNRLRQDVVKKTASVFKSF